MAPSMQPFINFLNSNAGENIGKFFGEISGYGLGLAVAAAGIGLVGNHGDNLGRKIVRFRRFGKRQHVRAAAGNEHDDALAGSLGCHRASVPL